ncbi:hypothetical protein CPB84DRAFT_810991 [Gymnopilus junonius]|uniref:Nucleoprotein TPR/MLP1 domain-containing protein n=1 Tax=Gymnopilus junonius TaxID=109634 RepID=A0A9P5NNG8_GYMJU|nr:hypothetical protein CPB84DRAFT_810991 [Gymnopilus junonius]
MTKTRRQSKAADAESAEGHFNITLPDDLDGDQLSEILPEINLTSLSPDDVVTLYRTLLTHSINLDATERERDEVKAELEKKDIELDQALQDRESSSKDLEASVESVHEELAQVKRERDQLAQEKAQLQGKVNKLSNSQSSSSTEVETLKRRVEDTEREKRELVGVISRLKDESAQREEEIQTLRANLKEARQEHQGMEAQVRELRSTGTATKFKIESLTQQLQLSQAEVERTNNELNAKTEEFGKYRRIKHTEIATLQASFDSLTQSHASSEASFKALQSAHTAQSHQLTQALSKVQALTGQLAEQEARYSNEASGLKRLVSMMEEREKQAKEIVENIEREWSVVGEKAERREAILKEETEREKKGREEAEKRLEQLEAVLDRIGKGELPVPGRGTTSTPLRTPGAVDQTLDGMIGLSPTVAMASRTQRSGKTFTEVYADYVRLQEEFAKKSAEYDHMDRTLSAVLAQIEERAPILSQQRIEYERLQVEASQLGSQLSQALTERDAQANLAQEQTQKLNKSTHENDLLQKQLGDLGRQVQTLLREITRRDDPTIPADEELEGFPAQPATDTQTLISNHLVAFKSIGELQVQNQRLLKIVRDLGEKMESEEREYREAMEKEQAEAIKEAHEAMQELAAQLERQKKSSDGIIHAYVKERDTLRAMLERAQKQAPIYLSGSPNINGAVGDESELAKELAEIQGQFEAYKTETNVDSGRLRDELSGAQRELNQMGAALAKANAKVEYLTDRHRMHEEQFRRHNLEIEELSKRNNHLHEQNVRFDIECLRLTDELQVAVGRVEQLRNENANLRAEKKISDSVQNRLVEENRSLAMERSHLADLMSNVQKMHNDLERSGENDRRRLESQLQMLEDQTQDLRTQLVQERDAVRHVTLQKDLELKDLQTRLDKNAQEFSKTRESLIEAQTSRKHLEEKITDLTKQLQGNEEKLSVYERRPGTIGTTQPDQDAPREQQLEAEVAELRSSLKVTEVDLAAARSHRDQFQEISQANEAALAALNTTFDEYKASSEAQIAHFESEHKALQERLDQANKELSEIRTQYNGVQKSFEAERTAWINDKKTLEDTIVDLSNSEKTSESDRSSREQDLRSLEERVKSAEDRYSHEIIAHAESMKQIEGLKKELSASQATTREHLNASETARAKLEASETSWRQQKEALDKEVADLNARAQDLLQQNTILHQHLESVSAQATRIRQASGEAAGDSDNRIAELRSVVNYLRKEKGIVDLQLEMSKRDNEVLKTQIDRLSLSLQETRATLAEERERAVESSASAAQHAELVERINQLNILRESNATLRAECESANKKARELESRLGQLSQELEPAKEQARAAQAELEATKVQMQRLEQESRRWQERSTQLLSKYDRIDPSEVQALKDEIAQLKVQLSESQEKLTNKEAEVTVLTTRIEALETNMRAHREQTNKNMQSFKAKLGELNGQRSSLAEEKRQLEAKVSSLEQEIVALQASQASKPDRPAPSTTDAEETQRQKTLIATLQSERDKLLAEKENWTKASSAPSTESTVSAGVPGDWEAEKAQLIKSRDEALEKLKAATADAQKAINDSRAIKFQNEKFHTRIQDLMKSRATEAEKQAALVSEAVEKAKAAEAEKQAVLISEAVEKAKAGMNSGIDSSSKEETEKRHAEQLRSLEERLKAQYDAELKARVESAVAEALKTSPASTPIQNSTDQQAAIDAALGQFKKDIETRHSEEIASAVERGRMEAAAKGKLKDSQLVKAQKRVKELEAQIQEWKAAGIVLPAPSAPVASASPVAPAAGPPTQTAVRPAPVTAQPHAGPSQPKPIPATAAAAAAAAAANQNAGNNLPRKPSIAGHAGPGSVARGGAVRPLGRGGVPLGAARGGAPLRTAPVKPTQQTPLSGGVSIMGAASKRAREEGSPSDDSLAKRLKPAEPANRPAPVRKQPGAE